MHWSSAYPNNQYQQAGTGHDAIQRLIMTTWKIPTSWARDSSFAPVVGGVSCGQQPGGNMGENVSGLRIQRSLVHHVQRAKVATEHLLVPFLLVASGELL